jgi:hypothetical protein
VDGNYTALIKVLKAAGATICGYVFTNYGARPADQVQADILAWCALYPGIDGIFLDNMPYDTGNGNLVTLYTSYANYCRNSNLRPVIANPGTNQQSAWFAANAADIIVVGEGSSWPTESAMWGNTAGGHVDYSYTKRALIVYGQSSLDTSQLRTMGKYLQWIYVTDATSPNPYGALPAYLEALFSGAPGAAGSSQQFGIAAAGTTQGTATALSSSINEVASTSAGGGVRLPTSSGQEIVVYSTAGADVKVYPPTGAAITGNSTNAPVLIQSGSRVTFLQKSSTVWLVG